MHAAVHAVWEVSVVAHVVARIALWRAVTVSVRGAVRVRERRPNRARWRAALGWPRRGRGRLPCSPS